MKSIKFSSDYPKLYGQEKAQLIDVRYLSIPKDMNEDLLFYDTVKPDGSMFPLKNGNYIQLIFVGDKHIPFCTIRSRWPDTKEFYYRASIGEWFEIKIVEQ